MQWDITASEFHKRCPVKDCNNCPRAGSTEFANKKNKKNPGKKLNPNLVTKFQGQREEWG